MNCLTMSSSYINRFGEHHIILGDGPQRSQPPSQPQSQTPAYGAILQLVANTNFGNDEEKEYSTTMHNYPLSLNPLTNTGTVTLGNDCDVFKFKYLQVEYTGQPTARELSNMFVNWCIRDVTTQDTSIFRNQSDYMKIYTNEDGNGGIVLYKLYSETMFPNGLPIWLFRYIGNNQITFTFKDIAITSATLKTMWMFLPCSVRRVNLELLDQHKIKDKWQYLSTNSVQVIPARDLVLDSAPADVPDIPERTTNHILDGNGNVHGMFVKVEYTDNTTNRITSLKIDVNGQTYMDYSNMLDFQLNSIKFDDCEWIFVPFDLERRYNTIFDCFVADNNGGLELGRVDTVRIKMNHQAPVKSISYTFPAYMSLHQGFIVRPELTVRTSYFDSYVQQPISISTDLTAIDVNLLAVVKIEEDCVISHEPIETGDPYLVCTTCTKPTLLNHAISWLNTPASKNTCPHCRTEWKSGGENFNIYKQE